MAAAHDPATYKDIMVVLGTAAVVVPLMQRIRVSPVLGFLLAGAALGPHGLGRFAGAVPGLSWITPGAGGALGAMGELGVVFLMFLIGLELSLQRLVTMRRLVFGVGGLQVVISSLAIGALARAAGLPPSASAVIGLALALSSTAIVLELLSEQGRLPTATGRTSFAVLLLQDLAVVPLLLFVSLLGAGQSEGIAATLIKAFAQAVLFLGVIVALGAIALRPLFRLVASSGSPERFMAAVLLVAAGSGVASAAAGLSMALGAFVAGLLLAETEYRRAIETTLEPFKGLLLGALFFTVGMSLDLGHILAAPLPVLAGVAVLVVIKAGVLTGLLRAFGFSWPVAVKTGLLLGPGGEFAFIVLGLAIGAGLIEPATGSYVLAVTSVSMALIPFFDLAGQRVSQKLERAVPVAAADPALALLPPAEEHPRAIVIGHGRVGELVSDMLSRHGVGHVVTERAPGLVTEARKAGRPVYYGDGKSTEFLARCGLAHAKAVIITIHTWLEIDDLVAAVRSEHPKIVIVSRARDAEHARHLYEIGVTDAVPETIEASLQLSEAALVGLGVPTGPVIASIHERRDEFRHALQAAARLVGKTESRGVRAKKKSAKTG